MTRETGEAHCALDAKEVTRSLNSGTTSVAFYDSCSIDPVLRDSRSVHICVMCLARMSCAFPLLFRLRNCLAESKKVSLGMSHYRQEAAASFSSEYKR
ncbi:hypothetical protein BST61_g6296 [Cercospora zeina]